MFPPIAARSGDHPLTCENISPYSLLRTLSRERMSPLRPDKKGTKANDSDHTCVTASWFQQCHAPVYMPKVGRAVGPLVKLCSRLSSPLVQRRLGAESTSCHSCIRIRIVDSQFCAGVTLFTVHSTVPVSTALPMQNDRVYGWRRARLDQHRKNS